ncbi:hypothetical protein GQ55_1G342900 [Panicum hallii var. hallii]|uniref:Uncharacterized protein n=1 Tax=Panicum hallii var. hallii TaxID=1504633 RepID=A0A2T7FAJ5_9POAL|nr:hypothetical protein GQ55_1G342900 [Panicum hallii var. hallii]
MREPDAGVRVAAMVRRRGRRSGTRFDLRRATVCALFLCSTGNANGARPRIPSKHTMGRRAPCDALLCFLSFQAAGQAQMKGDRHHSAWSFLFFYLCGIQMQVH